MKFSNFRKVNASKKTATSFRSGVRSILSIYPANKVSAVGSFYTDKNNLNEDMRAIGSDFQLSVKRIVHG